MSEYRIRLATSGDRAWLEMAMLRMILDGGVAKEAIPFSPTEKNCSLMYDNVLSQAIDAGDPILVAEHEGVMVAAAFWTIYRGPYEMPNVRAFAYGTYVSPEYRMLGLSKKMRDVAISVLKDLGAETVDGVVDLMNTPGVESALSFGFKPHSLAVSMKV
jgi:L-amino acid N-acyltransferase YncA